jgi:hypothetical protein
MLLLNGGKYKDFFYRTVCKIQISAFQWLRSCPKINYPFTGLFFIILPPENAYIPRYARIFSRWMAKNISRQWGWFIYRQFLTLFLRRYSSFSRSKTTGKYTPVLFKTTET